MRACRRGSRSLRLRAMRVSVLQRSDETRQRNKSQSKSKTQDESEEVNFNPSSFFCLKMLH
jgi:hypothetical protein